MSGDMEEPQIAEETPVQEKVTTEGPRINGSSSNRSAVDFVAASGGSPPPCSSSLMFSLKKK